jgi:Tol biopolymer transport system component
MRTLLLALALAALAAAPAQATFPGRNGRIVVASNRSGSWQLHSLKADGSGLRQITALATDDPGNLGNAMLPDVSPDGRRVVFAHEADGDFELYVVNTDGSGLARLTNDPDHFDGAAHWSPDGTRLVFSHDNQIATMAATPGALMTTLTTADWDSFWPQYTPDGRHILFDSQLGGLVAAIWTMRADGSHQRRLTDAPIEAGFSDISPDGRHVAFINHQNTSLSNAIFRMRLDGSAITQLTNPFPLHDVQPVYSPDGKRIAFVSDRRSGAAEHDEDLYVMDTDGSHVTRIAAGQ